MFISWMSITLSFKKSLTVEQFQGNYLNILYAVFMSFGVKKVKDQLSLLRKDQSRMLKMHKVCKVIQVKIIRYFFWRWIRHNCFTSLRISLNRKWWSIPIQILILYEHLTSFTQSLRVFWIYASSRNAELVLKEEAFYLRFFTQEVKARRFWISCCESFNAFKFVSVLHYMPPLLSSNVRKP